MKLNKKECRRYANPELTMPPDHGLLYAPQVDYIVHTEVKVIDHHRTLILFVYPRAQAAQGDFRPLWTVFHSRDNYITLAHNPDGTTKWRTAAFERLSDDYYFVSKCAFYSATDQERVSRYFNDDSSGFAPLLLAQSRLLDRRLEKRLQERDRKVRARMRGLPALPCDLERWAHQTLLPAYFFYDRARGGRAFGRCSSCGQDVTLTGVRHNATLVCPRCGNEIVAKARGRRGWLEDRTTGQVIQKNGPNELVVRILKAYCYYKEDTPTVFVYTPKTNSSVRYIKLPPETMELLQKYRKWYQELQMKNGDRWHDNDYVFVRDNGEPKNPDVVTQWLRDFSERRGLPHINPHAFRHTMASILIYNGKDIVSVSKRLGHKKKSTTEDIYSHLIQEADEASSECLADVMLRPRKTDK